MTSEVDRIARVARRRVQHLELRARRYVRSPERVHCPVCDWRGPVFAPSLRPRKPNRICPGCGATERYRAMALWLNARGRADGARLLEVAPIRTVEPIARSLGYEYASVDLMSPRAMVRGDLCALPFATGSFDVIVCFHVLEHIPDDASAVRELVRIARDGEVLVIVPCDRARPTTFEEPDTPPEDRERLYGQEDHVRIYGADVAERWRAAGVDVVEQPWTDHFTPAEHEQAKLDAGTDDRFYLLTPLA